GAGLGRTGPEAPARPSAVGSDCRAEPGLCSSSRRGRRERALPLALIAPRSVKSALERFSLELIAPRSVFWPGSAPSCSPGVCPAPRADTDPGQNPRRDSQSTQVKSALALGSGLADVEGQLAGQVVTVTLEHQVDSLADEH